MTNNVASSNQAFPELDHASNQFPLTKLRNVCCESTFSLIPNAANGLFKSQYHLVKRNCAAGYDCSSFNRIINELHDTGRFELYKHIFDLNFVKPA